MTCYLTKYKYFSVFLIFLSHFLIFVLSTPHTIRIQLNKMSPDEKEIDIQYRIIPEILRKFAFNENISNEKVILKDFELNTLNESMGFLLTICYKLKLMLEVDSELRTIFIFIKVMFCISH